MLQEKEVRIINGKEVHGSVGEGYFL